MKSECDAVFLFIAELNGSFTPGSGNKELKINCGQLDYIHHRHPKLDLTKEDDRKDLHESMWLERLYNELDKYFGITGGAEYERRLAVDSEWYKPTSYKWTVPIECDAGASMLQYIGILLNDRRLMEMTNLIGDTLQDPWKLEGMDRTMLKVAATPMLYGSAKSCWELWQSHKIEYTKAEIELYQKEMAEGPYGIANLFKEFIINNCNPRPSMDVVIGDATFNVQCNRFRNIGEKTSAYKIWDSIDRQYNVVLHTDTKRVPDLEQFRRYFVTLLVHHLDSVVMDNVMSKVMDKYGWGIPIHDAAVISPAAAEDTRKWYAEELESIHRNRRSIMTKFFKSIGITGAATSQWASLQNRVTQYEGELKVSDMALK